MVRTSHAAERAKPRPRRWFHALKDNDGSAALEFGIVAPIFLTLVAGIVQFGFTFGDYMFLTNAVMAGSQTLSVSRGITNPWTSTVNAMLASAPLLTPAQLRASISITVNGTSCAADAACVSALNTATGQPAVVTATYPCNLTILGVSYVPGCTLSSQVAQIVQ
jgi:Flp pilus assembly protein TadG